MYIQSLMMVTPLLYWTLQKNSTVSALLASILRSLVRPMDGAPASTWHLRLQARDVRVEWLKHDKYRRIVGKVLIGGRRCQP